MTTDTDARTARVIEVLRTIHDPEIPVNIYELGLIYKARVGADGRAYIQMTLTSPACPVAKSLPVAVRDKVSAIDGVTDATVDVVWDPPWTREMMTEAARLQLGLL